MPAPQKWQLALSRFKGFCSNLPSWPKEDHVNDYHAIISALEEASGHDLSTFRILPERLAPRVISVRRAPYRGGEGSVSYSRDKQVELGFFRSQIDALKHYLPSIQPNGSPKTKYDDLTNSQLIDLMADRGIKPPPVIENGQEVYRAGRVEREWIIAALVRHDATPAQPSNSTTLNFIGSNVNYASPGANITANTGEFSLEEVSNLILGLRELLKDASLDSTAKNEINVNIG